MLISKYFDHVAIALSTICIVHCLAVPVVVALLPVVALTYGLNDAAFHTLMLWFVVPSSVLGFAFGYHAHRGAMIVLARRRRHRGAGVRCVTRPRRVDRPASRPRSTWRRACCSRSRTGGTFAPCGMPTTTTSSPVRVAAERVTRPASSTSSCVKCSRCAVRCDAHTSCVCLCVTAASVRFSSSAMRRVETFPRFVEQ